MVLVELFYCRVHGIDLITLDMFLLLFLVNYLFSLIQTQCHYGNHVHNDASSWAGKKKI